VSSKDGLWLSIAVTLGMALVTGLVQPFAQPQANTLQSFGFASALACFGHVPAQETRNTPLLCPVRPISSCLFDCETVSFPVRGTVICVAHEA
jgi:hypothetical protein